MGLRPRQKRRRLSAEQARIAALDAAEALFLAEGFQAVKMKEVAAKAGVAPSNLSHHFGSVDELRFALTERMIDRLFDDVVGIMENASIYYMHGPDAVREVFDLFGGKSMAQLVAWLILNGRVDDLEHLTAKMDKVRQSIQSRFWILPVKEHEARYLAERAIYLVIVIAMGEGLAGGFVSSMLNVPQGKFDMQAVTMELLQIIGPAPKDWALPPIASK